MVFGAQVLCLLPLEREELLHVRRKARKIVSDTGFDPRLLSEDRGPLHPPDHPLRQLDPLVILALKLPNGSPRVTMWILGQIASGQRRQQLPKPWSGAPAGEGPG